MAINTHEDNSTDSLKELHGSPTGGHFGVMKTLQKVRERFYWNKVRSDVEKWFAYVNPLLHAKVPENVLEEDCSCVMWERVPNEKLLTSHFRDHQYGVSLPSDQGRNFDSAVCKRLCEILGIDKTRTIALHPQSDGMIDRFNRTILNSLSLSPGIHKSTGLRQETASSSSFVQECRSQDYRLFSSQMLFGRDLRLPVDLLFIRPPDAPLVPEEYVEKLQVRMEEMHRLARNRIGMAS
ncbi:retrovirus-related Pol polyprotein from transposon 412 [Trichonephila clavipes]|nr:retrovirus-related Pol polyprotein from transposon 412 [Trichonephila clavipes]